MSQWFCCWLLLIAPFTYAAGIANAQPPDSIAVKTAGMEKQPGFFTYYWDRQTGKIWLEIDKWDTEFLYVNSLSTGVGSNDIGLDRGQLGQERVVKFQRIGPKVLLVQPNYTYRAVSDNPDERRAVEEAFAQSVLWGFKVAAEYHGRVLVDAEPFLLRDAHDVIGTLQETRQGSFEVDASRSAVHVPRTKNFPDNSELDVLLTFTGKSPGALLSSVTPTPEAVTVHQHHSLIRLPDGGYKPRRFDPRAGYAHIIYRDYASPIGEDMEQRYIARHRLQKKNPGAQVSEPVEPIVYYLDRGTPEPVRSALLEGASWWNEAFETAGFRNAFRVEMMPEGADPMDVRYNVIQWVHRSTRGWSYGSSVVDPRTGEIIKGHVTLGSLRVRQDYLIAEALLAPYADGTPVPPAMEVMALARLRQLSAHEVGHTLGLAHNFAASTAGLASVMDYPHPMVTLREDGALDLSQAYDVGIGEWDKTTIQFGYSEFEQADEEAEALNRILGDAIRRGIPFISDQDARTDGGAHPRAHLWDNGADPVAELERVLRIRGLALERFSERNIKAGAPMAMLEEVLTPLYLFHRYQVEAVSKIIGGLDYTYALRGDGQFTTAPVDPDVQRRALKVLLTTLQPAQLALPERILQLIPPRPLGYARSAETFASRTGVTFDAFSPVESAASHVIQLLLNAERAARLIEHHARDPRFPGFTEALDAVLKATWYAQQDHLYHAEIARVVNMLVLRQLASLVSGDQISEQVRAISLLKLQELQAWLQPRLSGGGSPDAQAHYQLAATRIGHILENPADFHSTVPARIPAGEPIGNDGCDLQCDCP